MGKTFSMTGMPFAKKMPMDKEDMMDHGVDEATEKPAKVRKPKPQGKGIVKALGQKGTTGNFKRIEKAKGKGAAIAALQNKLAKRRGQPIPFKRGAK